MEAKANILLYPGFTKSNLGQIRPIMSYSYMYFIAVSFLLISGLWTFLQQDLSSLIPA